MISYLKWEIIKADTNFVTILLNSWIGYDVLINEITYAKIKIWEEIELHIYHHITEWNQNLFWFLEEKEKEIFKELIKISWIWWKVALSILSIWISRLVLAVNEEDKKTIEQIKWIWKKMASKIILELKDKDFIKSFTPIKWLETKSENILDKENYNKIKTTLVSMWYNWKDIEKLLDTLPEWINTTEKIIPYIIKNLS